MEGRHEPACIADSLFHAGFRHIASVGCSVLEPILAEFRLDDRFSLHEFCNEGTAYSYALGYQGAHRGKALVAIQNSGLGNLVNPATAMGGSMPIYRPALLVGHRGGSDDEEQHRLMGAITRQLIECLRYRPVEIDDIAANRCTDQSSPPAFLIPRRRSSNWVRASAESPSSTSPVAPTRRTALEAIVRAFPESVIVGAVGYIGRELADVARALGHRHTVSLAGGMGCASAFAAGLAVGDGARRTIVVEGDGSALMRLEGLHDVAQLNPGNLVHVVLNNHCHESTGGQQTGAESGIFANAARIVGYASAVAVASQEDFEFELSRVCGADGGPVLVECEVGVGGSASPRPTLSMASQLERAVRGR